MARYDAVRGGALQRTRYDKPQCRQSLRTTMQPSRAPLRCSREHGFTYSTSLQPVVTRRSAFNTQYCSQLWFRSTGSPGNPQARKITSTQHCGRGWVPGHSQVRALAATCVACSSVARRL